MITASTIVLSFRSDRAAAAKDAALEASLNDRDVGTFGLCHHARFSCGPGLNDTFQIFVDEAAAIAVVWTPITLPSNIAFIASIAVRAPASSLSSEYTWRLGPATRREDPISVRRRHIDDIQARGGARLLGLISDPCELKVQVKENPHHFPEDLRGGLNRLIDRVPDRAVRA